MVTVSEMSSGVQFSESGTLEFTGSTMPFNTSSVQLAGQVNTYKFVVVDPVASESLKQYELHVLADLNGPTDISDEARQQFKATSGSGNIIAILFPLSPQRGLTVPDGYVSGSLLAPR